MDRDGDPQLNFRQILGNPTEGEERMAVAREVEDTTRNLTESLIVGT